MIAASSGFFAHSNSIERFMFDSSLCRLAHLKLWIEIAGRDTTSAPHVSRESARVRYAIAHRNVFSKNASPMLAIERSRCDRAGDDEASRTYKGKLPCSIPSLLFL